MLPPAHRRGLEAGVWLMPQLTDTVTTTGTILELVATTIVRQPVWPGKRVS